jgi:Holliday junction DNA helicase RuvA
MIYKLNGILIDKKPNIAIVDLNGIAFEVNISLNTFLQLPKEKEKVELYCTLFIRDDTTVLFGFINLEEKKMFTLLNKVTSIGPKLASNILSGIKPDELRRAIVTDDKQLLISIPGVGRKTAERIIVELKDSFKEFEFDTLDNRYKEDVLSALLNLGYSKSESMAVLKSLSAEIKDFESMLKYCLKKMSKH